MPGDEVIFTLTVYVGRERVEWQEGPWLARERESLVVPLEIPAAVLQLPRIQTVPARLGVHVDVDALNAVLPVATLLWNDGQLSLHLDDVLDGLVVPASEDLGAAERVDRRMALAEQLDALPPGDTGLGGVP